MEEQLAKLTTQIEDLQYEVLIDLNTLVRLQSHVAAYENGTETVQLPEELECIKTAYQQKLAELEKEHKQQLKQIELQETLIKVYTNYEHDLAKQIAKVIREYDGQSSA